MARLGRVVLAALGLGGVGAGAVEAQRGAITAAAVTAVTDTALTLDSNKPCTSGPHAVFAQFRVRNSGTTQLRGAQVTLSGFAGGIALAGGQAATQDVMPLDAGQTQDVYWFLQYPCTLDVTTTLAATVTLNGAAIGSTTHRLHTIAMLSAQAGGNLVAQSLTAVNLGAITYVSVEYSFGGVSPGETYNLQPAGNTDLNAGCFQLLGSRVVTSDVLAIPVGTVNQMQYTAATKQPGSDQRARLEFKFRALCAGVSSMAQPYANQQSGNTNLKYSGNYDTWGSAGQTAVPGASNPFVITKRVTPDTTTDGGPVTYRVTIANTSATESMLDSLVDVLPPGVTFTATDSTSAITAANSLLVPAAGATGRIRWRSVPGLYWLVPAGGAIQLVYRAVIPRPEQAYVNSVSGFVAFTLAGSAQTTHVVRRLADLAVTKSGPPRAFVGDTLRYVLTTTNAGPDTAVAVVLSDTLPRGLAFLDGTRGATAATPVASGPQVVTWPAVAIPIGATLIDTAVVVVTGAGVGTNVARAQAATLDPTAANNDGTAAASRVALTLTAAVLGVIVTPDGGAPAKRLPGTRYGQPFVVTNTTPRPEAFDLLLRVDSLQAPPAARRDSVTGPGIPGTATDSLRLTLPDSAAQSITVWYTVTVGDTAVNALVLTARAVRDAAVRDTGAALVRRTGPALALTKTVAVGAGTAAPGAPAGVPLPGAALTYTVAYANTGEFAARNATVDDAVPSQVAFQVGSAAATVPAGLVGTLRYSKDAGVTWTYTPVSGGCGAPAGFDACVTRLRLSFSGDLPAGAAASAGTITYQTRIR